MSIITWQAQRLQIITFTEVMFPILAAVAPGYKDAPDCSRLLGTAMRMILLNDIHYAWVKYALVLCSQLLLAPKYGFDSFITFAGKVCP